MSDIEKGTVQANPPPRAARRSIANPAPLGLFGFASTTLILSLFNVSADNIKLPNAVLGMALFYGGVAQFMAGMWEFVAGNTFGATAFSSYGAFWLSFATFYIPSSGIVAAYGDDGAQLDKAIGIYLMSWMTVTFLFFVASLRKNVAFLALFFFLTLTFLFLGAAKLADKEKLGTTGGALGIITALIAYYIGFSDLLGPDDLFRLPLGHFSS